MVGKLIIAAGLLLAALSVARAQTVTVSADFVAALGIVVGVPIWIVEAARARRKKRAVADET